MTLEPALRGAAGALVLISKSLLRVCGLKTAVDETLERLGRPMHQTSRDGRA